MVRVFYALNDGFVGPTSVSLYSLLNTTRSDVEVNILSCNLSDKGLDILSSVADLFQNATFAAKSMPDFFLEENRVSDRARANLCKLLLPIMYEGRAIYIDGDTIIRRDVDEIWRTELGEDLIAGSPNLRMVEKQYLAANGWNLLFGRQIRAARAKLAKMKETTGLSDARRYINSGVMVMDLDGIRASGSMAQDLADFVSASKYSEPTQTWIARTVSDRVKVLGPEWNMYSNGARANYLFFPHEERKKYKAAARDPAIVHFVGKAKPWRPLRLATVTDGYRWRRAYLSIAQKIKERTGYDQFDSAHSAPVQIRTEKRHG